MHKQQKVKVLQFVQGALLQSAGQIVVEGAPTTKCSGDFEGRFGTEHEQKCKAHVVKTWKQNMVICYILMGAEQQNPRLSRGDLVEILEIDLFVGILRFNREQGRRQGGWPG